MDRTCTQCQAAFQITDDDLAFLEQVSPVFNGKKELISPPTLCPDCRQQKRIIWRNERTLYRRACDLCKKQVISMYAPDKPLTVYCTACYWSDNWDQDQSGQEFDFTKTFAENFNEVLQKAPLIGLINMNTENSEYCNRIYDGRNNYLSYVVLFESENVLYSHYTMACKDVVDVSTCQKSELCYEMTDGENCHRCFFSSRVRNCSDSWFLEDCISCRDCFQCKNLQQKQYCIQNKQYSKEEYDAFIREHVTGNREDLERQKKEAREFFLTQPYRAAIVINCENATGSNIFYLKDCRECYDLFESERMYRCSYGEKSHDMMDCYGFGISEFCYECLSFMNGNHNAFALDCAYTSDLLYCYAILQNSHDCFGCVGLKKRSYCILNKQYSKEEYELLMPKIIEHMRSTGEWGETFAAAVCPFGYNETHAQEYFPLTQDQAEQLGFHWQAVDPKEYLPATLQLPTRIQEVQDSITKETIACAQCRKNYRFIPQEIEFYRQFDLPAPDHCPDCRHRARMQNRPKRKLYDRTCAHCSKAVFSNVEPERPETIYCEECYLAAIY